MYVRTCVDIIVDSFVDRYVRMYSTYTQYVDDCMGTLTHHNPSPSDERVNPIVNNTSHIVGTVMPIC